MNHADKHGEGGFQDRWNVLLNDPDALVTPDEEAGDFLRTLRSEFGPEIRAFRGDSDTAP